MAALTLPDVNDAVWDVEVTEADGDPVFRVRVTSGTFGDGRGSATYIGPCVAGESNIVNVWLRGIYTVTEPLVGDPGDFGEATPADDSTLVGSADYVNPGRLTRSFPCVENEDTLVELDVTVMRPARQGFFDIAIDFNDIFCSAKFDTGLEDDDEICRENLLLHNPDSGGQRDRTYVLALACTAGPGQDVSSALYMDDIVITCPGGVTITIDPGAAAGNRRIDDDWTGVSIAPPSADLSDYVFQVAMYRGVELLAGLNKRYWTIAIGAAAPGRLDECALTTKASADDADEPVAIGKNVPHTIDSGMIYPYIRYSIPDLGICATYPIGAPPGAPGTSPVYTYPDDDPLDFDRRYPEDEVAPTCSDGAQNGDETGVDCGGECAPCPSDACAANDECPETCIMLACAPRSPVLGPCDFDDHDDCQGSLTCVDGTCQGSAATHDPCDPAASLCGPDNLCTTSGFSPVGGERINADDHGANGGAGGFGIDLSLSGDRLLVGSHTHIHPGTVSGGSAYVFEKPVGGGAWVQVAELIASDFDSEGQGTRDQFGQAVALEGDYALIGAPFDDDRGGTAGAVYFFERQTDGTWLEVDKYFPSAPSVHSGFGSAVALSGELALIGQADGNPFGDNSGEVFAFRRAPDGTWVEEAHIIAPDAERHQRFGWSIALQGTRAVIGSRQDDERGVDAGSAYVYERESDGTWTLKQKLLASGSPASAHFGDAVALDGERILVAASGEATSTGLGAIYFFDRGAGGVWRESQRIPHPLGVTGFLGADVALVGDRALVGYSTNRADIYLRRPDGVWTLGGFTTAPAGAQTQFGRAVTMTQDHIVIGSWQASWDGLGERGAAYTWGTHYECLLGHGGACGSNADCAGTCIGGFCASHSAALGPCDPNDDEDCVGQNMCLAETCEDLGAPCASNDACSETCVDDFCAELAGQGETCDAGDDDDCDGGLSCDQAAPPPVQQPKIFPSEVAGDDHFGFRVSVSGKRLLATAHQYDESLGNVGAGYVFERRGGTWVRTARLLVAGFASDDHLGHGAALDGDIAVLGASQTGASPTQPGAAHVFELAGDGVWHQVKLTANDGGANDFFGYAVALAGNRALVGAYGHDGGVSNGGAAYVFERQSFGVWLQVAKLTASDRAAGDELGRSVALYGDFALVGAYQNDDAGTSSGSAYLFRRQGDGSWIEIVKLTASDAAANDEFGYSLALNGTHALVGARLADSPLSNGGAVYVFTNSAGSWSETAKIVPADVAVDDNFGTSTALVGSRALIGAPLEDDKASSAGAVYMFDLVAGVWMQSGKLLASDGASGDQLGHSVSGAGDFIAVGAHLEDPSGGTNGGSVYVFELLRICEP